MKRIIIAVAASLVSTTLVHAQTAKPAPAPKQAPTTTAAPAPSTSTAPTAPASTAARPAPNLSAAAVGTTASTPEQAQAIYAARTANREQQCSQKGKFYRWQPPHKVGDANGRGGYFVSTTNGKCAIDNAAVRAASN